jgi:hypothetical protein
MMLILVAIPAMWHHPLFIWKLLPPAFLISPPD